MTLKTRKSLLDISKGTTIIFAGIIISNILGIITQILFGRILGPENYGLFNLGISIAIMIGSLITLGTGTGLTQYIPHNLSQKNYGNIIEAVNFSLKIPLIIGILLSIILFIFSDQIALYIFHEIKFGLMLKAFSIVIPIWGLHTTTGALTQSFRKPKFYVYIENILMPLTQLSFFVMFILIGYGLFGAISGFIFSVIFAFIAYIWVYRTKLIPSMIKKQKNSFKKINNSKIHKQLLSISIPLFLTGFTYLFMQYTDKILIGIFQNAYDVGIYTAALSIASMILFIFSAFSFNFRPIIAEHFALKEFQDIKKIYSSTTKWIFLITFPLLFYLILYSKDILTFIYGNSFAQGSLALGILSAGMAMNGLTGLSGETLISIRKTKMNLLSEIIGALSNVILNIILIPIFGIVGAAIGTSISIFLRNISSLLFVYKNLKFNPYNTDYLKIILSSIVPMIIIFLIFNRYVQISYGFLIVIPIFLSTYILFIEITNTLTKNEKKAIKFFINFLQEKIKP